MYLDVEELQTRPTHPIGFDEDGFLIDTDSWNEELAYVIAKLEGVLPLTDCHWKVLNHIRERFFSIGALPPLRLMCRATELSREEIKLMFGSYRTIWRIAGLPNPGEEVKAYF